MIVEPIVVILFAEIAILVAIGVGFVCYSNGYTDGLNDVDPDYNACDTWKLYGKSEIIARLGVFLKELEKENEELKRNKTEAIRQERQKRKEVEAKLAEKEKEDSGNQAEEAEDKPLTLKEFDALMRKREGEEKIKQLATSESEEKLIRRYVDLGYNVDDAYLKANAHIIQETKQAERARLEQESVMAGYSRAVPRGKAGSPAYATDPIKKAAADGLTPEERKYL